jgi:hypothetical protein
MEKNEVTHALSLIYSDEQIPWAMIGVLYTALTALNHFELCGTWASWREHEN